VRTEIARADVVDAICVRFDGGTLRIEGPAELEARLPHTVWDSRTGCHRAPAHRYTEIIERLEAAGWAIEDSVAAALVTPPVALSSPPLRPYQADALSAWRSHACRGVVVLPTGAGKTRVAIAAIAHARRRTLVLVPTRALLEQWERELRRWYQGPIGIVGDGERRVEALTVMTFASGYQRLDQLGGGFGLLVVDEVHHFASGGWAEALEMCPATHRLGLTATAERPGSSGAERLDELIGPVVYEVGVNALVGTHLAPVDMVKHRVQLTPAERRAYEAGHRPFAARLAVLRAANPSLDWAGVVRTLSRSADGKVILAGLARAVAIAGFSSGKRALVEKLLARHWHDRTLVFTALARDAVELSRALLVPVITAEIGRTERHEILDGFRDGKYRAIVSARVLNEGLDVPDASVAIVVGARSGAREYVQRVGRVLRPGPAKRAIVHELITDRTLDAARAERRRQLAFGT
jgi:superfamily II DNA or RNA helicase